MHGWIEQNGDNCTAWVLITWSLLVGGGTGCFLPLKPILRDGSLTTAELQLMTWCQLALQVSPQEISGELLSFPAVQSVQLFCSLPPCSTSGSKRKSLELLHTGVDGSSYVLILLGAKLRLTSRFNNFGWLTLSEKQLQGIQEYAKMASQWQMSSWQWQQLLIMVQHLTGE